MVNTAFLMGRLTANPEVRQTQSGKSVARFTLAVDGLNKDDTDFIRCQAWEKKADFCDKYLHKGSKVVISGRIKTGKYNDNDGKPVYTTDIICNTIDFAESKNAEANNNAEPAANNDFMSIPDSVMEDLPFN